MANAGDITDLRVCIGDYQNTTKFFTSKNKVWCAPVREYAEGICTNCKKKHWIDTLCDGGDIAKPTDAGNRHSLCPNDMARDMEAGTFKRVTFRFQGGTGGLPKAKMGNEAVAAAIQVTTALGSVNSKATRLKKQQKAEKCKLQKAAARAATADDVESQAEHSDDDLTGVRLRT